MYKTGNDPHKDLVYLTEIFKNEIKERFKDDSEEPMTKGELHEAIVLMLPIFDALEDLLGDSSVLNDPEVQKALNG